MLLAGIIAFVYNGKIKSTYIKTDATITDIAGSQSIYYRNKNKRRTRNTIVVTIVEYDVNGQHYKNTLNGHSSSWHIGDTIPVYYNPDNPQKITNSTLDGIILLVLGALGLAFTGVSLMMIVLRLKKKSKSASYLNQV